MRSLLLIGRPAVLSVAMGSSSSHFFASELGEQEPLPVTVFLSRFPSRSLPRTMWQSVLLVTLDDLGFPFFASATVFLRFLVIPLPPLIEWRTVLVAAVDDSSLILFLSELGASIIFIIRLRTGTGKPTQSISFRLRLL